MTAWSCAEAGWPLTHNMMPFSSFKNPANLRRAESAFEAAWHSVERLVDAEQRLVGFIGLRELTAKSGSIP